MNHTRKILKTGRRKGRNPKEFKNLREWQIFPEYTSTEALSNYNVVCKVCEGNQTLSYEHVSKKYDLDVSYCATE